MEFIVFTDESSITASRHPSISAFSMPLCSYEILHKEYKEILKESGINEFKWSKLRSVKYYSCAEKIINMIFKYIYEHKIRIDTITWDNHDSRHAIKHRNDIKNYERMFFHLLKSSLRKRIQGGVWHVRPDERNGIDWLTIHECLSSVSKRGLYENNILKDFFTDHYFKIKTFEEKKSDEEILIQIPDLFSGMSSFVIMNYQDYLIWEKRDMEHEQMSFFNSNDKKLNAKRDYCCKLVDYFYVCCKQQKMWVSLKNNKCLYTYNPKSPINFWQYQPQSDYDKAPTK